MQAETSSWLNAVRLCVRCVRCEPAMKPLSHNQWPTQEFFSGGGGFQQIQLRTENGDLGAVAP
jgi:hypothetical protein